MQLNDILERARALRAGGRAREALALLEPWAAAAHTDPRDAVAVCVERQRAYRAWANRDARQDGVLRSKLFFRAQEAFYRAVYINPVCHEAFLEHAAFWTDLGDPAMARRLLCSLQSAAPHPDAAEALAALPPAGQGARPAETAPVSGGRPAPPYRILVVVIPGYDPGMDVLYDGLCTVLGADSVEEYPWKPLLHGQDADQAYGYPTAFNHPGAPRALDQVCALLREGHYAAVLYADIIMRNPPEDMRAIAAAARAGATPFFIVDCWDDASDNQPLLLRHLGVEAVPGYFKREMLRCHDYGPNVLPLPLSYPDGRVPAAPAPVRSRTLFWAGNRVHGLRRLYLDALEAALGTKLDRVLPQEDYAREMARSLIALSLCGFGYDTVRYWEAPAHAAMLLAERPPIRIPHDFQEGETAVFFDDLDELGGKLAHYARNPEEAARIALAGHAHFRRWHTASARAGQLLARMQILSPSRG